MDVLGKALLDYQQGRYSEDIVTHSSLDQTDELPLPYLFRNYEAMPDLEQQALQLCKGEVLDIGCGAGSHSLFLQEKGTTVTAIDASKGAIETCALRGIENCVHQNIYDFKNHKFDTLLLLMNGIGLAGKLKNLAAFFSHLKSLLLPGGQILLDSTDIIYMYEADEAISTTSPSYYGEVDFTMTYKKETGALFHWLYIDQASLIREAKNNQLRCEIVSLGEHFDYLARLSLEN